jgi:branched-chain amino acid transport system permease protein
MAGKTSAANTSATTTSAAKNSAAKTPVAATSEHFAHRLARLALAVLGDVSIRAVVLLAALFAVLLIAPWLVNDYLLTVLIVVLYFAFTGQAWNIMMGFAGQLSLGHAIYAGLGGYIAAVLFARFGIAPWIGFLAVIPVTAACGATIGLLAFRFRVAGVYFAILTIAFAEFARIGFDHLDFVNASAGLFLPVAQYAHNDLWHLRGNPTMFYYVILAAAAIVFLLCRVLLKSRIGYCWLAIREDEQAARAVGIDSFRYKMAAVMISAVITSFAGVFYAFFYNNLFPEQVFNISRSIEMILGPIIGGIGTLFGPILGAFVLTGLAEALNTSLIGLGFDLPGAKQVFYGICLLLVVVALPDGVWPWLARLIGVQERSR